MSVFRGLLLDFGGVMTKPLFTDFDALDREHDLPSGTVEGLISQAYATDSDDSEVARLERGEMTMEEMERAVASMMGLEDREGGVLKPIFAQLLPEGPLWVAAQQLRASGVRTGLLSNSWGVEGYPRELMAETFDVEVISGEVGMRKPQQPIYDLAVERLDVPAEACVFVDDHPNNLKVARTMGMTTVLHRGDHDEVLAELSDLFGTDLTDADDLSAP